MARTGRLAVALAWLISQGGSAVAAPPSPAGKDEIEREIHADVERVSAEAAELFEQANRKRDAGDDLAGALELYRKVMEMAPSLDHPHRRACDVMQRLGRAGEAVGECEIALKLRPAAPFNRSALAGALLGRNGPGDVSRALTLARQGVVAARDGVFSLAIWCQAAVQAENRRDLRSCADQFLAADPQGVWAHYMGTLAALFDGDVERARNHLAKARAGGLPEESYRHLSSAVNRVEEEGGGIGGLSAPSWGFVRGALLFTGAWIAGMVILLLAGWILSRLTLRAAGRVAATGEAGGDGTERERRLRRIYKAVVLLCGVYFYLSVPVLLLSILVTGVGAIYIIVAFGYIPIKLVVIIGLVVFCTVGAILRGVFARSGEVELGYRIDMNENPRFRALLDDVARTIGTRPVDGAYLTPQTDMAVTERGGLWKSLRGKATERCLIMGVGLLDGMKQLDLRSVLAHEYGHFRNEDTAGGGFALAVRRSLYTMIIRLAQSGAATWYNPVWLFLRAYHRVYLVVSHGASRLQEVLADRWAIRAYGSQAFIRGYTHVVERSVAFGEHVELALRDAIEKERPLPNLYRHEPAAETERAGGDRAALVREEMDRQPSAYDSHPAPSQRLAWAAAMAAERSPQPDDDLPAWDLFEDRESLEKRMTAEVREAVAANHGVAIAG